MSALSPLPSAACNVNFPSQPPAFLSVAAAPLSQGSPWSISWVSSSAQTRLNLTLLPLSPAAAAHAAGGQSRPLSPCPQQGLE